MLPQQVGQGAGSVEAGREGAHKSRREALGVPISPVGVRLVRGAEPHQHPSVRRRPPDAPQRGVDSVQEQTLARATETVEDGQLLGHVEHGGTADRQVAQFDAQDVPLGSGFPAEWCCDREGLQSSVRIGLGHSRTLFVVSVQLTSTMPAPVPLMRGLDPQTSATEGAVLHIGARERQRPVPLTAPYGANEG